MERLLDKCCSKCHHSKENPCKDFIECCLNGPICHDDKDCKVLLRTLRNEIMHKYYDRPIIIVGMGTCGIAAGAREVVEAIKEALKKRNMTADITYTGCIGLCSLEPIVDVILPFGPRISYENVTPETVDFILDNIELYKIDIDLSDEIIEKRIKGEVHRRRFVSRDGRITKSDTAFKKQIRIALKNCGYINPESIDEYILKDGYKALSNVLKNYTPEQVIQIIKDSGLRGRGGAGFPTGLKWEFARKAKGDEKYIVCNADEGDPGAFMDRAILEGDPHCVIEGMIIGAYCIGASKGYLYIRAEYPLAVERVQKALDLAYEYGLLGKNILGSNFSLDLHIKKGAGAFVCGEETALISSIEGKRGMPRVKPPFPANSGLWKKPTNINNVETYANISRIINNGAEWFSKIGTERSKGTKVFSLTGAIKNTGLIEVPLGITLREVIYEIGGGILNNREFKAAQTGGPSGGCIPKDYLDTPIDFESLQSLGTIMGSGGLVVLDDKTCMVEFARFFLEFTQHESCGKCIPCREGTKRMLEILQRITHGKGEEGDIEKLEKLGKTIKATSACGLGQTAPNPVLSTIKYFREEYEEHIKNKRCPAGVCQELMTYQIIEDKCVGCGLCKRKCPVGAIIGDKKKPHVIKTELCIKCGTCLEVCPTNAIVFK